MLYAFVETDTHCADRTQQFAPHLNLINDIYIRQLRL